MAAPIPTLGYRSRTAAAVALRSQGLGDATIADRIGISCQIVGALLASADRSRSQRPAEANGRTVLFPIDILDALRPHAIQRGLSVNELARQIVDTVAQEGLVGAVLDDEGAT